MFFAWILAIGFIVNGQPSQSGRLLGAVMLFVTSVSVYMRRWAPLYFVPIIPIVPVLTGMWMGLKSEDLLSAVFCLSLAYAIYLHRRAPIHLAFLCALLATLVLATVSFVLSEGNLLKGYVNVVITLLWILYGYYTGVDREIEGVAVNAVVQAGLVAGFVMITALFMGINLNDFTTDPEGVTRSELDSVYFFRGSFFYTNIFYVLGVAAIFTSNFREEVWASRLVRNTLPILTYLAVLLYLNKTSIIAMGVVFVISVIFSTMKVANILGGAVFFCALTIGYLVLIDLFPATQMFLNLSSLQDRFGVLATFGEQIFHDSHRLVFGYGPESLIRVNDWSLERFKMGQIGLQGTVDSTYLSVIIEFGILGILLLVGLLIFVLLRLFKSSDSLKASGASKALFLSVLYIAVCAATQVIGYSKVGWLVFFVFGLAAGVATRPDNPQKIPQRNLRCA